MVPKRATGSRSLMISSSSSCRSRDTAVYNEIRSAGRARSRREPALAVRASDRTVAGEGHLQQGGELRGFNYFPLN